MKVHLASRFFNRRNLLLIGLTAFLASVSMHSVTPVLAADKSIDSTTYSNYANNKYYLVFCARSGTVGHAFVVWGVENSSQGKSTGEAFGFYPRQGKGVLGRVPGEIRNEAFSGKMNLVTDRLIVQVDKSVYDRAQRAISAWSTTNYDLFDTNCINFVMSVARDAGLQVPSRSSTTSPSSYVQALINAN